MTAELSTLAPSKPVTVTLSLEEGDADIIDSALVDECARQLKALKKPGADAVSVLAARTRLLTAFRTALEEGSRQL